MDAETNPGSEQSQTSGTEYSSRKGPQYEAECRLGIMQGQDADKARKYSATTRAVLTEHPAAGLVCARRRTAEQCRSCRRK